MHVTEADPVASSAVESHGAHESRPSSALSAPPSHKSAGARSRAATRERLLASGKTLFAERGLSGVTTHDIAHNAGVAAGTFYLHFRDKRELFRELALEAVATLRTRLNEAVDAAASRELGVRAHSTALIDFAADHRDLVRILFSHEGDASAVEADVLNALASTIAEKRRERRARGTLADELDPGVLSQAIVGMLARVVAWWVEDPSRATRESVIATLTRIQLSGTDPRSRT
jgi:AcrR family transcriptional regulator